jgi:phosphohistidine phosphatase
MPQQLDFDRILNERGRKDAPMMAARLLEKEINIDYLLSSTANRALQTAAFFAEAYRIPVKQIIATKTLYHASTAAFYAAIATIPENKQTAAIFSHNPGITEFVNELTTTHIDNMPTCGIFGVQFESDNWLSFERAKKTFWLFDYPKG